MANFSSLNGISCDSISSVNGTSKSSINNVDGLETCDSSAAMTRLVAFFAGRYSWASYPSDVDDLTTWKNEPSDDPAGNMKLAGGHYETSDEARGCAYGKDGSGNPMYCVVIQDTGNVRVMTITHAAMTSNSAMTQVDTDPDPGEVETSRRMVAWGNDVWVATGDLATDGDKVPYLLRSTDGSTWSRMNINTLTDILPADNGGQGESNNSFLQALTSDGAGNWWMAVGSKIYKSSDNASTWALEYTLDIGGDAGGCGIRELINTNGILVCVYHYNDGVQSQARVVAAPTSNTSTGWGMPVHLSSGGTDMNEDNTCAHATGGTGQCGRRMAAATYGGVSRVVVADNKRVLPFNVSTSGGVGVVTIVGPVSAIQVKNGGAYKLASVVTDGEGTWWAGSKGPESGKFGRIYKSTDNGVTWAIAVPASESDPAINKKICAMVVDRYLPL